MNRNIGFSSRYNVFSVPELKAKLVPALLYSSTRQPGNISICFLAQIKNVQKLESHGLSFEK